MEEVRYANEALGLVYYDLKFYSLQEHLLMRAFFVHLSFWKRHLNGECVL